MNTKNLPLMVGIALPLLLIGVITLVIFGPSLSIKPAHDFIYTSDDDYYSYTRDYLHTYKVMDGRITLEAVPPKPGYAPTKTAPPLYLYDVQTDTVHQITFEDARGYVLDPGPSSPDGYSVSYQYGHDGIFELFGSSNEDNGYVISKGDGVKRLSGITGNGRYSYDDGFKLLGWIQ